MDGASPGAVGLANDSGWMTQLEFVKYMQHFIQFSHSSKQSSTLLLLDNHASHLSVEALDLATDHGVTMLSFPPHCSHRMQPLDVSVYGPLKVHYRTKCDSWLTNNAGKVLEIRHIPMLVGQALLKSLTAETIQSGFRCTGIYPFTPDIFNETDFIAAVLSGENNQAVEIEREYSDEQLRRICVISDDQVAAHKEVSTSEEPSTSASNASIPTRSESLSCLLSEIGPMQAKTPRKKSNRGRKSMKSAVLTSPENISTLKESHAKREAVKAAKEARTKEKNASPGKATPAKKPRSSNKPVKRSKRRSSSSSDGDADHYVWKTLAR